MASHPTLVKTNPPLNGDRIACVDVYNYACVDVNLCMCIACIGEHMCVLCTCVLVCVHMCERVCIGARARVCVCVFTCVGLRV